MKVRLLALIEFFIIHVGIINAFSRSKTYNGCVVSRKANIRRYLSATTLISVRLHAAATVPDLVSIDCEYDDWLNENYEELIPVLRHGFFGNLRGLVWSGQLLSKGERVVVAKIPSSKVLSSQHRNNPDWDAELALKLWREIQAGSHSSIAGYCRFLTRDKNSESSYLSMSDVPPSTAPHSLRHWSVQQKEYFLPLYKSLLNLEEEQAVSWRQQYDRLGLSSTLSWPQYQWAMETVYSRAFAGIQTGTQSASVLLSLLAPVVSICIIYIYATHTTQPSEIALAGLALLATLPTMWTLLHQQQDSTSVLLPLIDSANHWEEADSRIDFDPLRNMFTLSIGPSCLVSEEIPNQDGSFDYATQLYVNYGNKSDTELMLNYGFLPGVRLETDVDEYRRELAEAFCRNKKS